MKKDLKNQATTLRKRGYLYSEIAAQLGVSKSTAYTWTKSTRLSERQSYTIMRRLSESRQQSIQKMASANIKLRKDRDKLIVGEAAKIIRLASLSKEHESLICAVLFWCEGGKDVSSGVKFINSDPMMIKKFLSLLRSAFPINENKFRALVHLHEYHDEEKQLRFWSDVTQIPLRQFNKSYRKPNTGKNQRPGYAGCISVRYLDASLGKLLKMIYSEFSQNT